MAAVIFRVRRTIEGLIEIDVPTIAQEAGVTQVQVVAYANGETVDRKIVRRIENYVLGLPVEDFDPEDQDDEVYEVELIEDLG